MTGLPLAPLTGLPPVDGTKEIPYIGFMRSPR
jgi:hypothetical protein